MAATAERRGWFARRQPQTRPSLRVLTAAATRLDLSNRKEAQRQHRLREGWQFAAWSYRDSVPELTYAAAPRASPRRRRTCRER